jgi:hypothetical protein
MVVMVQAILVTQVQTPTVVLVVPVHLTQSRAPLSPIVMVAVLVVTTEVPPVEHLPVLVGPLMVAEILVELPLQTVVAVVAVEQVLVHMLVGAVAPASCVSSI